MAIKQRKKGKIVSDTSITETMSEAQAIKAFGPLRKGSLWMLPGSQPHYIIHIMGTPVSMNTGQRMAILESSVGEFMTMPIREVKRCFVRQKFVPLIDAAKEKLLH